MATKHSNWRDDLREVVDSDSEDQNDNEIKEKKVKNKIDINPSIKESIESIGGQLIDIREISEGKCDDCTCKGCGDDGVGHQNPCIECGGHHKEEKEVDEAFKALTPDKKRQIKNQAERRKKSADRAQMSSDYETSTKQDQQVRNMKKVSENVAAGVALSPQELQIQRKKSQLDVRLAKKRQQSMNKIEKDAIDVEKQAKDAEMQEGLDTFEKGEQERIIKGMKKDKKSFVKRYGKRDAADVMYATATKLAKNAGDTSKSDKRYAAEDKAFSNVVAMLQKKHGKDSILTKDNPPKKPTDKQKAEWKAERAKRAAQNKPTGNPYKPRQGESD